MNINLMNLTQEDIEAVIEARKEKARDQRLEELLKKSRMIWTKFMNWAVVFWASLMAGTMSDSQFLVFTPIN